jgi:uncharacterized protein YbjT (DUF2867 family)
MKETQMILVVGSTGSLGMSVVKGLIAPHKEVAALVRDVSTDKATELKSAGAALVVGDLKSRSTLDAALKEIDTVICTASSTMSRREGDSIETVDQEGVQNLIDAAEAANIKRFVFVSFSRNIGNDFPLSVAKRAAEKRLESSSIDYTILLPSYFAEIWFSPAVGFDTGNGKIRIYGDGNAKVSYVAIEDVAKAMIASLDNPKASRKAIPIGGPNAISQLDAVALFEKATGRKMQVEFMTADQIAGARKDTKDSLMGSFLGLFDSLAKGDEVPAGWTETLGATPQSMEDWVSKSLKRTFSRVRIAIDRLLDRIQIVGLVRGARENRRRGPPGRPLWKLG